MNINLEIPEEILEEVVQLIRCSLASERVSNEAWTLLMNFCDEYGKEMTPEDYMELSLREDNSLKK